MTDERTWIGLTLAEMEAEFAAMGEKPFRGRQMADWIYKKGVDDTQQMSSFSLDLRSKLTEYGSVGMPSRIHVQESRRDPVWKALVAMQDNALAECVLMRYSYGNSVCLSTQIGCKMGCTFCASGSAGFLRNLTAGEILGQLLVLRSLQTDMRVSHIVLMGMGEPLDNFDEVVKAMAIANASWGFGIGYRHITLSTAGFVPGIDRLRQLALPINLSISLHAPNDAMRIPMMPIAASYPLKSLMAAAKRYVDVTHRRITYEYAMIDEVNDKAEHAEELAALLRGHLAHVNLIPINPIGSGGVRRSRPETINAFAEILQERGIEVTIRREMGSDISAACGQLRLRTMREREGIDG